MCYAHCCPWTLLLFPLPECSLYHFHPTLCMLCPSFQTDSSCSVSSSKRPSLATQFFPISFPSFTLLYFYRHIYYYLQLCIYVITCFTVFPPEFLSVGTLPYLCPQCSELCLPNSRHPVNINDQISYLSKIVSIPMIIPLG